MKHYISDEQKKKQIDQMWEEYERANKQSPQQFKTEPFSDLNVENIDEIADIDPSFDTYDQIKFKNRRKSKKTDKKSKFSQISEEDTE